MTKIIDNSYDAQVLNWEPIRKLAKELGGYIPEYQSLVLDTRIRRDKTEPQKGWDLYDIDHYECRVYSDGRLTVKVHGTRERYMGFNQQVKEETYDSESPIDEYEVSIFDFKKQDNSRNYENDRVVSGNWIRGDRQTFTIKGEGLQELLREKIAEAKVEVQKQKVVAVNYRENKPDWLAIEKLAKEISVKTPAPEKGRDYWVLTDRYYIHREDNNQYGMNEEQRTNRFYCLRTNGELFVRTENEDNVFEASGKPYSLYKEEPSEYPFGEKDLLLLDHEPKDDYREYPGKPYHLHRGNTEAGEKLLVSKKGEYVQQLLTALPAKEKAASEQRRKSAEAAAKAKAQREETAKQQAENKRLSEEKKQEEQRVAAAKLKAAQEQKLRDEEKARNTFTDDWEGYCKKTLKRGFRGERLTPASIRPLVTRRAKEVKRLLSVLPAMEASPNALTNVDIPWGKSALGNYSLFYQIRRNNNTSGKYEISIFEDPRPSPSRFLGKITLTANPLKMDYTRETHGSTIPIEGLFEILLQLLERLPSKSEYAAGLRIAETRTEVRRRLAGAPEPTRKEKLAAGEAITVGKLFRTVWWGILGVGIGVAVGWFFAAICMILLHWLGVPGFIGETDMPLNIIVPCLQI